MSGSGFASGAAGSLGRTRTRGGAAAGGGAPAHASVSRAVAQSPVFTPSWYHAQPLHASRLHRAWVATAGLCAACAAAAPPEDWVGSTSQHSERAARERAQPPAAPWEGFESLSHAPATPPGGRSSQGHADGRFVVEIRVEPAEARAVYEAWTAGSEMPVGTAILATHHDPRRGRPGPSYAMKKGAQGWEFAVLTPDGKRTRDAVELCARCHAEAHSDSVFGPPRTP